MAKFYASVFDGGVEYNSNLRAWTIKDAIREVKDREFNLTRNVTIFENLSPMYRHRGVVAFVERADRHRRNRA